jgi:putative ABC transport system permease protein
MRWRTAEKFAVTAFRQIAAVSTMNLRSVPQRIGASSVVIVGIAGVVAVLVSVLAMSTGLVKTLQATGPANRVIVVRTGANAELLSYLTAEEIMAIGDSAGIAKSADGHKLVSPETLMTVNLVKRNGDEANAPFRGISPQGLVVHPEIKVSAGRSFRPGVAELIVGKSAGRLYRGVAVGSHLNLRGTPWTVVGTFESGGGVHDSELIGDLHTLNSAYQRGNTSQSVLAITEQGPAGFTAFKDAITTNPQLQVDVAREKDFGMQESDLITRILFVVAYVVGGIMAIGAIFGALNTMYSTVSARAREIATLRAIGFGATSVVVSVFVEALLLALAGGIGGALLAWWLFNGHSVDTLGGDTGGQLVFDLVVTPGLMALGVGWACLIGVIGGLFPAVRAARLPVATSLRAV